MAGNDGNDSKNSGCMATDKHDSAGRDPDVQVTFAQNSPDQKNPLMRNPVIAAVIYAIVFAAICVLYTAIGLFTYFAYVILAIPACILIPFAALLLTRKIRTLWNPLWLAGTAILTYATTLVSIAEAITLISSRLTLWTAIIELLTGSFTNGILFIVSMGGYSIPTIFYILYLICRAYDNRHNR